MDKHDRTVIITGGASGIGKSLAFQYGRNGYNVVIGDIEEPTLEDINLNPKSRHIQNGVELPPKEEKNLEIEKEGK